MIDSIAKLLRRLNEIPAPLFEKGGKLERFHPLFEAHDTFLFTPGEVTKTAAHVRDGIDLKRMMIVVVVALLPCMFMAMYNTGLQANLAFAAGAPLFDSWQARLYDSFGLAGNTGLLPCLLFGALYFLPIYLVTLAAGGVFEVLFAIVRRHEINEGFLVTSALLPLTLPPTIPLWMVALGAAFGVVFAKEVYGGTGKNWLNPALTARAFLFFAYPAFISGDAVWIAAQTSPDGYSGATPLALGATGGIEAIQQHFTFMNSFLGFLPGSMGETSTLCCLIGAVILIATGVGSWRTMAGAVAGSGVMALVFNTVGSDTNLFFNVPFYWHWVLGGFAFAIVFMATDPVTSAFTNTGKLIYGFFIGVLGLIIRVVNPAYPEGWMLAILFMNGFAPLIDHFVVQANIKRRNARYAA